MKYMNTTTGEVRDVPDVSAPTSLYDVYKAKDPNTLASVVGDTGSGGSPSAPTPPKPPKSLQGWGKNAASDVTGMVAGLAATPALAARESVGGQVASTIARTPDVLKKQMDILTQPGENKYGRMVGEQMNASPAVEQAKLLGTVGKSMLSDYWKLITDPVNAFYEHPVNSTLDALTIIGAGSHAYKLAKAKFDGAAKATELAQSLKAVDPRSASLAERTYANTFTIPTKRAKDLRPLEVSKKMLDYGVGGSLDDMKNIAGTVTGRDGVLSQVTREAVGRVPAEINLNNVATSVENIGSTMLDVKPEDIAKITKDIATKLPPSSAVASNVPLAEAAGVTGNASGGRALSGKFQVNTVAPAVDISTVNAMDAYDLAKQLERQAADLGRRSTYLTPNLRYEQLAKLYKAAANEITDQISLAVKGADVVEPLKTPEVVAKLQAVSPKLAKEFMKAKTFEDLRHLQAPFVKLSQMVDLSLDAELSAARKLGSSLAGRLGLSLTGGAVAGIPGMIIGSAVAPAVEPYLIQAGQNIAPRILTGSAKAMTTGIPAVQRAAGTARAIGAGAKSAAAAAFLRKFLQYGPTTGQEQTSASPIQTQAMTQSERDMIPQ